MKKVLDNLKGCVGRAIVVATLATMPFQVNAFTEELAQSVAISSVVLSPVVVPSLMVAGSAALTVVVVEQTAKGTRYVLKRASDGVEFSIETAAKVSSSAMAKVGESVATAALASGIVLSAGSAVIAFIPNELGRTLMHNERLVQSD